MIPYANWKVRGKSQREEDLDGILNEMQIKIAAITKSKNKLKGTTETNIVCLQTVTLYTNFLGLLDPEDEGNKQPLKLNYLTMYTIQHYEAREAGP